MKNGIRKPRLLQSRRDIGPDRENNDILQDGAPITRTPAQEASQNGMSFPFLDRSLADLEAALSVRIVELQRINREHELVRQNLRARQNIYGLRSTLCRAYRPDLPLDDIAHLAFYTARANADPQERARVDPNLFRA